MRRIALWLVSTVAVVVLLFSYKTSTMGAGGTTTISTPAVPAGEGSRVDGSVAQTRWGPVQVRFTVSGRKITDITVLASPDGNHRDVEINEYALPILRQEALQAQSADIQAVSGATVTSEGYKESLQAALDQIS
jgi:uncharacterized protein with FMN-binding domain